jgi:hypothetical protein
VNWVAPAITSPGRPTRPTGFQRGERTHAAALALRLGRPELARALIEGVAAPSLSAWADAVQAEELRRGLWRIVQFARVRAELGLAPEPGSLPANALMAALQRHLETIGALRGAGLAGSPPSLPPLPALRAALHTLESGSSGGDEHDYERWRVDLVLEEVVAAMIDAAIALGPATRDEFVVHLEARLSAGGRLSRGSICRALAFRVFREDHNTDEAIRRLKLAERRLESTPGEHLAEIARDAVVLVKIGSPERARGLLAALHDHGLGYALAPKKDPQYLFWKELLVKACSVDPSGRHARLAVFGRLLQGLSQTEGRSAGRRLVDSFAAEAAQAGPGWAAAALDKLEDSGLATWPDLVNGVVLGVARVRPDLARVCSLVYGRLGLPWTGDSHPTPFVKLIAVAPGDDVAPQASEALTCIETDGHPDTRVRLLTEVLDSAARRGEALDHSPLDRWRNETPGKERDDDHFAHVTNLSDLRAELAGGLPADWNAVRAFEYLAPRADFAELKALYSQEPAFGKEVGSMAAFARAAVAAGALGDAVPVLQALREHAAKGGGCADWRDGAAALRYFEVDIQLRGEPARAEAFEALAGALAEGRESGRALLHELCDLLEAVCSRPPWSEAWNSLVEQLQHFREYRLATDLSPLERSEADAEETLSDLLFRASDIGTTPLARAVRALI